MREAPSPFSGFVTTSPIGSFKPKPFGLFDPGGNACQWCEDWYDQAHMEHVLRGGAWNAATREEQQSSYRFDSPPGARLDHDGFRCVLSLPPR